MKIYNLIAVILLSIFLLSCTSLISKKYPNDFEIERLSDCALALKIAIDKNKFGGKYRPSEFINEYELTDDFGKYFTSYIVAKDMTYNNITPEQAERHITRILQNRGEIFVQKGKYALASTNNFNDFSLYVNNILNQCEVDYHLANKLMNKYNSKMDKLADTNLVSSQNIKMRGPYRIEDVVISGDDGQHINFILDNGDYWFIESICKELLNKYDNGNGDVLGQKVGIISSKNGKDVLCIWK